MQRIVAVPFQVIPVKNAVILKRGRIEVKISGDRAAEVLHIILDKINNGGATKEELCEVFALPDRPAVISLIEELLRRRMLMSSEEPSKVEETELDIFYWHFGELVTNNIEKLKSNNIVIVGVNNISHQLAKSLAKSGIMTLVIDYPMLRSKRFSEYRDFPNPPLDYSQWENSIKPGSVECLVATSDFGGLQLMKKWNEFCIEQNCVFLPVVLQDLIGYVGPIVKPNETACFECFLSRRNANYANTEIDSLTEKAMFEMQKFVGFHPTMASILGDIAAMELIKFYANIGRIMNVGKLISVNLLAAQLESHNIMRVPRCIICSKLNKRPSTTLVKFGFFEA